MVRKTYPCNIRPSKELMKVINEVRVKYIMNGKKPPTISKITKYIVDNINKEDLMRNVFIRF